MHISFTTGGISVPERFLNHFTPKHQKMYILQYNTVYIAP